jgi:3-hydroxybutyryl-CoA dehydratase
MRISRGVDGRRSLQGKRRYEDIEVGERATSSKTVGEADISTFAAFSGDHNPIHVDEEFAKRTRWGGCIAHGMLVAGLVTQTLSELGGEGAVHVSQEVSFLAPVRIGDTVTVVSEVTEKREDKRRLLIASTWTNQDGVAVIRGRGELLLPRER